MRQFFLMLTLVKGLIALPFDEKAIEAHIRERFSQATVELEPFPHLVISEIVPKDFYDYMASQWPNEELFDRNSPIRRRLLVTQGCLNARFLPQEQKEAWQFFGEVVVNQFIKDRIKELFLPQMKYKFSFLSPTELELAQRNIEFMNYRSDGLNFDKSGYLIGAHVDQAFIYAALMIYFPTDAKHAHYGTVLYRSIPQRESRDVVFPPASEFQPVKTLPFLPNTLVVFLQTPKGWHGVEKITEKGYIRRAYQAALGLKPEFAEQVYGDIYRASELYLQSERCLNPNNFQGY